MLHIYNLLLHICNLFPACKTCCCIHRTFSQTCITCFPNLVYLCLLLCHTCTLVKTYTTCLPTYVFVETFCMDTSFVQLILKLHNMAPNMCVTIKYSQLLWHFRTTCYRLKVWLIDWSHNPSFFAFSMTKWRLKLLLIWSDFHSAIVTVRDGTPLSVP